MLHMIWPISYGSCDSYHTVYGCWCNLAIKSSSTNNSLFGYISHGGFAPSIADIIEANFSNTNFGLIFTTKILPAIDISTCGDHCTIDIFEFSEKKSGAIYSFVEVKVSLITSLSMIFGPSFIIWIDLCDISYVNYLYSQSKQYFACARTCAEKQAKSNFGLILKSLWQFLRKKIWL